VGDERPISWVYAQATVSLHSLLATFAVMRIVAHGATKETREKLMEIAWAKWYRSEWDEQPERYHEEGIVGWGNSRRLAKARDDRLGLKAYLGVQHHDPGRWNLPGEPVVRFFLSLFVHGQTISLRVYPTMSDARAALVAFQGALRAEPDR
jgi:hypothetical protein